MGQSYKKIHFIRAGLREFPNGGALLQSYLNGVVLEGFEPPDEDAKADIIAANNAWLSMADNRSKVAELFPLIKG